VIEEIRSSFCAEEEITFKRVANMKYVVGIISKSMRLVPAGPEGVKRGVFQPYALGSRNCEGQR
jgi:hypothetical protein